MIYALTLKLGLLTCLESSGGFRLTCSPCGCKCTRSSGQCPPYLRTRGCNTFARLTPCMCNSGARTSFALSHHPSSTALLLLLLAWETWATPAASGSALLISRPLLTRNHLHSPACCFWL